MSNENSGVTTVNNDLWKHLIGYLISAIIGIGGSWIAFMREVPNRAEVSTMILKESPYVRDQQFIMSKLTENSRVNEVTNTVLVQLKVEIARLSSALEHLDRNGRLGNAGQSQP